MTNLTFRKLHPHFVAWDHRATMHRGRPFDDASHRRELRVTTLDIDGPQARASQRT